MKLMTKEAIHNFGIKIVYDYLKKEGHKITSVDDTIGVNPQINAIYNDRLAFICVRTECLPKKGELEDNIAIEMIEFSKKHQAIPYFASIGIANSDVYEVNKDKEICKKDNSEDNLPVVGAGFYTDYKGLVIITTSDRIKIWGDDGIKDYKPNDD